jgi:phosphoribosylaminoimidazolecarboxamide formyltransferase/IMP cyclohydrolase
MNSSKRIRRALISVSDKTGLVDLGRALESRGVEILASGGTAQALSAAGVAVRTVESFSGSPEAFQGRMKTLSFRIFGAILARRGDASDDRDLETLSIPPIDLVVVNFYPFEQAAAGISRSEHIELIDIGGPSLVRAAAKNAPDVLVLTDPQQYSALITELGEQGGFSEGLAQAGAARAWSRVAEYDRSIEQLFGESQLVSLRYGENPHQAARFEMSPDSPIAYDEPLTENTVSYNNILDASAAYQLVAELKHRVPDRSHVVIVKHNNPCGVASVRGRSPESLKRALELAWQGDPVSAFGGVLAFSEPLTHSILAYFEERFVELLVAPGLARTDLESLMLKRKGLKALACRFNASAEKQEWRSVDVVGGRLSQVVDRISKHEEIRVVSGPAWSSNHLELAQFGISVNRALKSNAIALVGSAHGDWLLLGAGQGQPNRIDSLRLLAVPRALETCERVGAVFEESILISDAFFPFADSIDACFESGVKRVVQPGGSLRDTQVIEAAQRHGVGMALSGVRHFLH